MEHLRIKNDDRRLPDSKTVKWDLPYAIELIEEAVNEWQINTVSTGSLRKSDE